MSDLRKRLDRFTGRRWKEETLPGIGKCLFRSFTEAERAQVEAAGGERVRIKRLAVIFSFCDPVTKEPVYTLDDMDYLGTLDGALIDKLASPALSLSRISDEDMKSLMGEPGAS